MSALSQLVSLLKGLIQPDEGELITGYVPETPGQGRHPPEPAARVYAAGEEPQVIKEKLPARTYPAGEELNISKEELPPVTYAAPEQEVSKQLLPNTPDKVDSNIISALSNLIPKEGLSQDKISYNPMKKVPLIKQPEEVDPNTIARLQSMVAGTPDLGLVDKPKPLPYATQPYESNMGAMAGKSPTLSMRPSGISGEPESELRRQETKDVKVYNQRRDELITEADGLPMPQDIIRKIKFALDRSDMATVKQLMFLHGNLAGPDGGPYRFLQKLKQLDLFEQYHNNTTPEQAPPPNVYSSR